MFQVTIQGKTLQDLTSAMEEHYHELTGGIFSKAEVAKVIVEEEDEEVESNPAPVVRPDNVVEETQKVNEAALFELDSEGVPWDKRIHASSHNKLQNGTWRLKRGVDKDEVENIKQELRQKVHHQANPTPVPAAPINENTPVVEQPAPAQPAPVEVAQPAAVAGPTTQPTVAPTLPPMGNNNGHTFETFSQQFAMVMANLVSEGKLTQEYVNSLKEYFQVDQIWEISEDQKREVFEMFAQNDIIKKVG